MGSRRGRPAEVTGWVRRPYHDSVGMDESNGISLSRRDLLLAVATLVLIATQFCSLLALVTLPLCRVWSVRVKVIAVAVWLGPAMLTWFLLLDATLGLPRPPDAPYPFGIVLFAAKYTSWILAEALLAWGLIQHGRTLPKSQPGGSTPGV